MTAIDVPRERTPVKQDIFISYSRKDTKFVELLYNKLNSIDVYTNRVWLDRHEIESTEKWKKAIQGAIESTITFIFVISPDSISSPYCRIEIEDAIRFKKRIIPILYRTLSRSNEKMVYPVIASLNWIVEFSIFEGFEKGLDKLKQAIEIDIADRRFHRNLAVASREWKERKRHEEDLLHGRRLKEAEAWLLKISANGNFELTAIQQEYIEESRKLKKRNKRWKNLITIAVLLPIDISKSLNLALAGTFGDCFGLYHRLTSNEKVGVSDDPFAEFSKHCRTDRLESTLVNDIFEKTK